MSEAANAEETQIRERGILFSKPMVLALLANEKTQTRRMINFRSRFYAPDDVELRDVRKYDDGSWRAVFDTADEPFSIKSPYGGPGDRLWVRETWQAIRCHDDGEVEEVWPIPKSRGAFALVYAATDPQANEHRDDRGFAWRPGIYMPRWASRILLDVVGIRAERLQDISEADAIAEGVERDDGGWWRGAGDHKWDTARRAFESLWCSINGVESWRLNPWVWVVSFKRIEVTP